MKKINSYNYKLNNNMKIRLNANESYKNISNDDLKEIIMGIEGFNFNRYPDSESNELRESYAKIIGVSKENLIAGNGSDEMISLIISSQITSKNIVLTISPDFSMYDFYTSINDGIIKKYNTKEDGDFSIEEFVKFGKVISPKVIIFSNPNNPTGHAISNQEILYILDSFKDSLVVIDEAYHEFYGQSVVKYIEEYKNLVVTRTLSKAWGLAALRVGFLIANKKLVEELNKGKPPYNLNSFSQAIACDVLNKQEKVFKNIEEVIFEREKLYKNLKYIEKLSNNEIRFYKSNANFIFGRSDKKDKIKKILEDRDILIRYFNDDSFRISIGSALENELVFDALEECVLNMGEDYGESIKN